MAFSNSTTTSSVSVNGFPRRFSFILCVWRLDCIPDDLVFLHPVSPNSLWFVGRCVPRLSHDVAGSYWEVVGPKLFPKLVSKNYWCRYHFAVIVFVIFKNNSCVITCPSEKMCLFFPTPRPCFGVVGNSSKGNTYWANCFLVSGS